MAAWSLAQPLRQLRVAPTVRPPPEPVNVRWLSAHCLRLKGDQVARLRGVVRDLHLCDARELVACTNAHLTAARFPASSCSGAHSIDGGRRLVEDDVVLVRLWPGLASL
jgi:hypothetical protein